MRKFLMATARPGDLVRNHELASDKLCVSISRSGSGQTFQIFGRNWLDIDWKIMTILDMEWIPQNLVDRNQKWLCGSQTIHIVIYLILLSYQFWDERRQIPRIWMFSGCFDRAPVHEFLARSEIQTDLSFCFVYMRCFSMGWIFNFGLGWSYTLAGRM